MAKSGPKVGAPILPLGPTGGGVGTVGMTPAQAIGDARQRRDAGQSPGLSEEDSSWLDSAWDTLTGQTTYQANPYGTDVSRWTDALDALAGQYMAAPMYSELAMRAAGDRAAREATARAASARGVNSALGFREAEMMNEAHQRQLASDAAAASAMEGAQRFGGVADILTGAGNLDVAAQGIAAGSSNNAAQINADTARQNRANQQAFYSGLINTGGEVISDMGSKGSGSNGPKYYDLTQPQSSDVRGKEAIQQLSPEDAQLYDELAQAEASGLIDTTNHGFQPETDPALQQALLADLENQAGAAERTEDARNAALGRALEPKARPRSSSEDAGSGLLGLLGAAAGTIFGGPAGGMAGGAVGSMLESSDRRGKTRIKPIRYSYSDKLGKEEIALLEMATTPAANRQNLGPMNGYQYRYKPAIAELIGEDTEPRIGTMAQEVERGPAGRNVVEETPNGKALDVNRALGFSLAGLAGLDKRLRAIEGEPVEGEERERILREADETPEMELGFDEQSGIWRELGSTIGEAPTDPAYERAAAARERQRQRAGQRLEAR